MCSVVTVLIMGVMRVDCVNYTTLTYFCESHTQEDSLRGVFKEELSEDGSGL